MQRLQKYGFFALVALALTGCGAVAVAATSTATDSPTSSSTANSTATATASPTATTNPYPCPADGSAPYNAFCVTSAQYAAGYEPVHLASISDASFLYAGWDLMSAPSDQSTITMSEAISAVEAAQPDATVQDAVFAEMHESHDLSSAVAVSPVWIVDITPPGYTWPESSGPNLGSNQTPEPSPSFPSDVHPWVVDIVNPSTGAIEGTLSW